MWSINFNHPPLRGQGHSRQPKGSTEIQGLKKVSPPSKGGEIIMNELNFDIPIRLSLLIIPVKSSSDSLS
jgi:hypothetical protein